MRYGWFYSLLIFSCSIQGVETEQNILNDFQGKWIGNYIDTKYLIEIPENEDPRAYFFQRHSRAKELKVYKYFYDHQTNELVITVSFTNDPSRMDIRIRRPRNELIVDFGFNENPHKQGYAFIVSPIDVAEYNVLEEEIKESKLANKKLRCSHQLYEILSACGGYGYYNEEHYYPSIDIVNKRLTPAWSEVYPRYIKDPSIMICPFDKDAPQKEKIITKDVARKFIDDHSYWYLGYILPNETIALKFLEHYKQALLTGGNLEDKIQVDQNTTLIRLHKDAVKLYADGNKDAESALKRDQIPIFIERPKNHSNGGHVIYMNHRVEFIPYPGKYPMTEKVIEALRALDELNETQ